MGCMGEEDALQNLAIRLLNGRVSRLLVSSHLIACSRDASLIREWYPRFQIYIY